MNTPLQTAPYLREQRQFPTDDLNELTRQIDHAYIDIASKVNNRTIGLFAPNNPVITGDKWYFTGPSTAQQSLRQVYPFTTLAAINHRIPPADISKISHKSYGTITDGTNWYGVIYGSNVAIAGQYSFYVTPTQIILLAGGGAPVLVSGYINLEFISVF